MRVVVKIGSNLVASEDGLDLRSINRLTADIAEVKGMEHQVLVVSSGAIAAGVKKLGLKKRPADIKQKQAAAAVGQSSLMWAYEKSFSRFGIKVAQVLLTRDAFTDRQRYINARNTLLTLLDYGVIPIINENDTVAVDEIRFGDNDQLASMVAALTGADRLVILSDVEGLYTSDPLRDRKAELISEVREVTDEIIGLARASTGAYGTGGMYSKVLAARRAVRHGIGVHIISGRRRGLLQRVLKGERIGTVFLPSGKKITSRKGWIAFGTRAKGIIKIDRGAEEAILRRGKSLLPSGIVAVKGTFSSGDAVYCVNTEGRRVAKGLTNYSSEELLRIKGLRTSEIINALGYKYSDEVIHRDNLVILEE